MIASGTTEGPAGSARGRRVREMLFVILAVGFALSAVFHAVAIVAPQIAEPSPAWRHGLFVVINGVIAVLFVRRPRWFPAVFGLLALQQLYSHGTYGYAVWRDQHRVDWASVLVLAVVPVVAVLLVVDALRRRRSNRAG